MDINNIAKITADYFNISITKMLKNTRVIEIVEPRQIFHYLTMKYTDNSLTAIGKFRNGNYHHATVIHSREKVEALVEFDKAFRAIVTEIETIINSTTLKEYKFTNKRHIGVIKVKAENENKAIDVLNGILESVQIESINTEGWELDLSDMLIAVNN